MDLPPFQLLVDAHWRDVARLAHALAGPIDGDDVAQQAWTQALAAYPQLRSNANLRSWLLTITHRCATDLHRARGRRAVPVPDLVSTAETEQRRRGSSTPTGPAPTGPTPGHDPLAGHDTSADRLWAAVGTLPDRQRRALVLRYVADLDHTEIAQELQTTSAATRRLVSDALRTLRTLEEWG